MASDLCNKLWTMVKLLLFSRKSQADWNSLRIFNLSLFAPLEFWNNDVMVMLTLWIQFMICCMLGWKHSHLSIHFSWSIGMLTSTQAPKVPNRPAPAQKVVFSWKLYIIYNCLRTNTTWDSAFGDWHCCFSIHFANTAAILVGCWIYDENLVGLAVSVKA